MRTLLLGLSTTAVQAYTRVALPPAALGASRARSLCMMGGGGGFGAPKPAKKKKVAKKVKSPVRSVATRPARDTFKYAGDLRPGVQSPRREVPASIPRPDYHKDGKPKNTGPLLPWQIEKKTAKDIEGMRAAGLVAREVLDAACRAAVVGATTDSIDAVCHEETLKRGAYPV